MITEDMDGRPRTAPLGQGDLENRVLETILLQADVETYGPALRARLQSRTDARRQLSGVGFFLEFWPDRQHSLPELLPNPIPHKAFVKTPMADYEGGCILFCDRHGAEPDFLEVFPYAGEWPSDVTDMLVLPADKAIAA